MSQQILGGKNQAAEFSPLPGTLSLFGDDDAGGDRIKDVRIVDEIKG